MQPKTTDLCDAREDIEACTTQLRSFGQRRWFAGMIRTIRCHEDIGLMRDIVNQPGNGQVLVVDGAGSLKRALFGDVMANVASKNGWAGFVIYAAVRDCVEIDSIDIGVKALGTVSKRGEKAGRGEVDVPVTFGNVTFELGRRLVADEDGVILLPKGLTEANIAIDDVVAATAAYAAPTS